MKKLANKEGLIANADASTTPRRKRLRRSEPTIEPNNRPVTKKARMRDGQTSSVANLPARSNTADGGGGGSGSETELKETPIDDPHGIYCGLSDYTFPSLPF